MRRVLGIDLASATWAGNGSALLDLDESSGRVLALRAPALTWPAAAQLSNFSQCFRCPRSMCLCMYDHVVVYATRHLAEGPEMTPRTAVAAPARAVHESDCAPGSRYEQLLPEFFPVKLIGAFIAVDFVVGCSFDCAFCISRRHPAREALFGERVALDTGLTPRQVLAWLRSMPSYRAGVQLRLGHDTDAGLEFEKSRELIELLDPDRSVVYLTRKPFTQRERSWFARPRTNVLLKLTATPRSQDLGMSRDPLELVRSARGLDVRRTHWVVGPLTADSSEGAGEILRSLPRGSRLTLKPLNTTGLARLQDLPPVTPARLAELEREARALGHTVTEWFCRDGLAPLGQGFFDVDQVTAQCDPARRASDLAVCSACPSHGRCHRPLDEDAVRARLAQELPVLGLTLAAPPLRTGPRAFRLAVREPSSRGDETYLSHALGQPVRVRLTTRERGISEGGSFCNVDTSVLRRWWSVGFLPVAELNAAAAQVLRRLRARLSTSTPAALAPAPRPAAGSRC